ncbi:MAG: DUF917 domain-containing protein [Thermoplasmata archaeon]|nr:DUF917 domain-containing protein [Thermoplasmata archaeon]
MRELKEEELKDMIVGCTVLGTGGGGDPEEGWKMVKDAISEGKRIRLVSLDELDDDAIVAVPYFVGSIAPGLKSKKEVKISEPIKVAFERMEEYLGQKISAVVASELGGGNTAVALSIAARLDLPIVDGDLLGRAAPELHQCTVHIYNVPMYPSVIVTESGNVVIVERYADIDDYEAIARYISVLGGKFSAVVDTPMSVRDAKNPVVEGTLSLGIEVGKAIRVAREENRDPVEAVANILSGWKIFEGIVKKYEWRNEGGFLKGEVLVEGTENYSPHKLKSWIMNEHIMVWMDDEPILMPPDLLIFLKDDGTPITNTELSEGMKINAIATKAPDKWRTPNGLKYFGPKKFGFDYEYIPVEELVKRWIK